MLKLRARRAESEGLSKRKQGERQWTVWSLELGIRIAVFPFLSLCLSLDSEARGRVWKEKGRVEDSVACLELDCLFACCADSFSMGGDTELCRADGGRGKEESGYAFASQCGPGARRRPSGV